MDKNKYVLKVVFVNGKTINLYLENEEELLDAQAKITVGINNHIAILGHDNLTINSNNILYVERA